MSGDARKALRLEFPDRYRLWSDLTRGRLDRLFIATSEDHRIRAQLPVELVLPGLVLPIIVTATVIGRRPSSERFPRGIYVRFPESEVEKCRRFLGVVQAPARYERGRNARRVHHELPVRFVRPDDARPFSTRNLSQTGLFVTCPSSLAVGQRVEVVLTLDDHGEVPAVAEVAWVGRDRGTAGLHFVDMPQAAAHRLEACLVRLLEARKTVSPPAKRPLVVADDDPDVVGVFTAALSRHGYDVYKTISGEEALGMIQQLQPALVVLDILLPGMDGVDICKMMRADAELVDIPVIFVSAMDSRLLHVTADEAGATDYLPKPVDLAELINMVGRYLKAT